MILESKKIKSLTVSNVFLLFAMKWWDQMPWSQFYECCVLSQLFHSPFTFIKRLFSASSLSAVRVVSSAYLRLLIFLPAILIPACASSSPVFLIASLSHSVVFLYFFALITEEGFLSLLATLWNSAFKWLYLSFSPLPLASLFSAICKASPDNHFAFLHFFFLE